MSSNYYDAVVLGMELGPLAAGALLARRGFRVLVLGQGGARDAYPCYGFRFVRRPFLLSGASSPVVSRIVDELSMSQLFSHILEERDPTFQVVLPTARVGFFADPLAIRAELERELPDQRGRVDGVMREIGRLSSDFEKLLQGDLVIPPESFFERREFSRALVQNPFFNAPDTDVFEMLGVEGDFRRVLEAPVRFGTASDAVSPLLCARQMGAWLFDTRYVRDGRDGIRKLLCDRIVGHGGDVQESYRAIGVLVKKGKVQAVRMSGRDEPTATRILLTDLSPAQLSAFVEPNQWPERFKVLVEDTTPPLLGYAVNLGVSREVVPEGMADTVFLVSDDPGGPDVLRVERIPQPDAEKAAFNVSCVVPREREGDIESGALRDLILDRMRQLVPFLDSHLQTLHSPFDGSGAVDLTGRADGNLEVPPVPRPEEVPRWILRPPPPGSALGIEALPHRTGIKGLLFSGGQVVSGLSTEGEWIAAWGAAKIATRMDPSRQRLVRSMRTKVEI